MNPECEKYLWDRIRVSGETARPAPRDVIHEMVEKGMIRNHKQAWATLEKWTRKRKYDYGVTLDLGWRVADEGGEG